MTKELLLAFSDQVTSARLYLEMLVKIPRLNLKTGCIDRLLRYTSFRSLALFSSRKKRLSYLSHAISPHLHGKMIN